MFDFVVSGYGRIVLDAMFARRAGAGGLFSSSRNGVKGAVSRGLAEVGR